jgi:carboxypeptidase C (cathepsin A)
MQNPTSPPSVSSPLPLGVKGERETYSSGKGLKYSFEAAWLPLLKKDKPVAEIFFVHYAVKDDKAAARPLTFSFNGGPGAAAAYLHVGALGPKRVSFGSRGELKASPGQLVENEESWLAFSDLVFVDPVGTGFSRPVEKAEAVKSASDSKALETEELENKDFFKVNRDIDSLCEFISHFLSKNNAWSRPVFIAGESYGGFRVGKLARKLQERHGVAVRGAVLVSPALEMNLLGASDYDIAPWLGLFPSLVASSFHHGKTKVTPAFKDVNAAMHAAEQFAIHRLSPWLTAGDGLGQAAIESVATEMSALLGLSADFIRSRNGRISFAQYSRELLRSQSAVLGYYDASLTADDPFPDRDAFAGPDPTLAGIDRAFGSAINSHLRGGLGVATDREYHLIHYGIFESWTVDGDRHGLDPYLGATDDLRFAMALNPHMQVWIAHGIFDLVTPYFTSTRLKHLLKLKPNLAKNLSSENYYGGHMFYTWDDSRKKFFDTAKRFYEKALAAE